jgi:hypothetical protein
MRLDGDEQRWIEADLKIFLLDLVKPRAGEWYANRGGEALGVRKVMRTTRRGVYLEGAYVAARAWRRGLLAGDIEYMPGGWVHAEIGSAA